MNIKGIQKTSLIDFPDRLSSVLFTGGCNFLCKFCHNPELVRESDELESCTSEDALELLKERSSLINGVVITGGEPTLARDIDTFLQRIKEIPLFIKLDTNGSNPNIVKNLLSRDLLDYIAIDVKTSPKKYNILTGTEISFKNIKKTIELVKKSGIDYELRTTCIPVFVTLEDFKRIKSKIGYAKRYYIQQFNNKITLDSSLQEYKPYSAAVLSEFREFVKTFADICEIRGI